MVENNDYSHWECPNCGEINESNFDACWNCEYEKTNNVKLFTENDLKQAKLKDFDVPEKDVPKSPLILNLIAIISIWGYIKNAFTISEYADLYTSVLLLAPLTISVIGLLGLIWLRKWGLYLYTVAYLIQFLLYFNNPQVIFLIYQIIPTGIIIWGFINYKKMR